MIRRSTAFRTYGGRIQVWFHPEPGSGLEEASFRRRQLPDAKSQLAPGGVQGGHSRPRFARAKRMDVSTRRRADRKGRGVAKISVNALTSFISGIPRRTGRLHGIVGKSRNQQLKRTEALFERAIATSRSGQSANSPGQGSAAGLGHDPEQPGSRAHPDFIRMSQKIFDLRALMSARYRMLHEFGQHLAVCANRPTFVS